MLFRHLASRCKKSTDMNDKLIQLYSSKWDNYFSAVKPLLEDDSIEIKPANPLLLYVSNKEEYVNADIKLMIFGQETNSWYEEKEISVRKVQKLYDGFFNDGECWNYGGQFWNGVGRFHTLLQQKYPDKKFICSGITLSKLANMLIKDSHLIIFMK